MRGGVFLYPDSEPWIVYQGSYLLLYPPILIWWRHKIKFSKSQKIDPHNPIWRHHFFKFQKSHLWIELTRLVISQNCLTIKHFHYKTKRNTYLYVLYRNVVCEKSAHCSRDTTKWWFGQTATRLYISLWRHTDQSPWSVSHISCHSMSLTLSICSWE